MSFEELRESVRRDPSPPAGTSVAVQALWHDARDDWARAHELAQKDTTTSGSWVHAYLHRKEGDAANARYWYTRARRKVPAPGVTLEDEWTELARELLARR